MNAIAPPPRPPKRAYGTGTVSYHRLTNTWRCRTPGEDGIQYSGFPTREAAIQALEDAERGIAMKRRTRRRAHAVTVIRATLRYALAIARMNKIDVEQELKLLIGVKAT